MIKIINSIEYKLIPIQGNEHYYISNEGYVYSEKSNKVLKRRTNTPGYWTYAIRLKGKRKEVLLHRMLALTYLKHVKGKDCINHKDGVKKNNNLDNLEWVTQTENVNHAFKTGLRCNKGENHPMSKLTEKEVIEIRIKHSEEKITFKEIAKLYNVSTGTVSNIINKKRFSHI